MIINEDIEKVKAAADIVEVVGDFVSLRRRGANYLGLCPFHNERTPSFSVSPAKGFCYCFSCHEGGDPVSFLMKIENMTYIEAIKYLANKYHIELHESERTDEQLREMRQREALNTINQYAMQYYEAQLRNTEEGTAQGVSLLYRMGIEDATIAAFHVGYSPNEAIALPADAKSKGFNENLLITSGVCERVDGEIRDTKCGRVVVPLQSVSGKTVAFFSFNNSGYLFAKESPIYKQDSALLGLFQSKLAITKEKKMYLATDYVTTMLLWQNGVHNVIGTSRAAVNVYQLDLVRRLAQSVTVVTSCRADHLAKAINVCNNVLSQGFSVRLLPCPEEVSVAQFVKSTNAAGLKEYIDAYECDFIHFEAEYKLKTTDNATAMNEVALSISMIDDDITRSVYEDSCSRLLGVEKSALEERVEEYKRFSKF